MARATERVEVIESGKRNKSVDTDLKAGMIISDRYRLVRPVASGGMATIWEAVHEQLNAPVAVKFIEVIGPYAGKIRDRFLREARVAAAIRHRDVVDIIDFGTNDDGRPFMVMELLEGETLAERLHAGPPLTVGAGVRIVARVLAGMAAVHEAGIVHRDVKPENIFLVKDGDRLLPKLLDFGVSRSVDKSGVLESVLPTVENAIVGTPQYMSPEQARGLPNLDHRSDLWGAGVMLFELFTGQLPYDAAAIGDIIIKIATADPPDFATLRPDLAGPLEEVVKKAMQKDPEARFQTATEMRTALLNAAAVTAAQLQHSMARVSTSRAADTTSDMPPAAASDLLDGVGDAYQPGDSGLLDFGDHADLLATVGPGSDAAKYLPRPIPSPTSGADPFAPTLIGEPAPPRARWPMALGGVVVTLALVGGGYGVWKYAPRAGTETEAPLPAATTAPELESPDPADVTPTITVELTGLSENTVVRVDGEVRELPIELERGDTQHAIEVRWPDGRRWSTQHVADDHGAYTVEAPRSGSSRRRRRRHRRSGAQVPGSGDDLMRDPGF